MDDIVEAKVEYNNLVNDVERLGIQMSECIIATECLEDDMNDDKFKVLATMTGYELSSEDSDVNIYKSRLKEIDDSLATIAFKKFKKFKPLASKINEYNVNKLKELKDNIDKGELVPSGSISAESAKSLNNKLGVFYSSGYRLDNGCSDLTTFITGLKSMVNKNSKYIVSINKMLNSLTNDTNVIKMNKLLNVKYSLVGCSEAITRKIKFTDYRFSIFMKWLSVSPELLTVKYNSRIGIKVSVDRYNYTGKDNIGTAKNTDTVKLLETGIKNSSVIEQAHSGLGIAIKILSRKRLEILMGDTKNRFKVAKFLDNSILSLINLYSDIAMMDDLIIKYVNLTYEKAK